MARFKRHESCPKCGSRDNLGRYDDGSGFCFGCHYYEKGTADVWKPPVSSTESSSEGLGRVCESLQELETGDVLNELLLKTNLTVPELLRAGAKSRGKDTIAFIYNTVEGTPCCVQIRSYASDGKNYPKYFNTGSTEYAFPLYHYHPNDRRVVITEDTLSALKVARVTNSFSALGTQVQNNKLLSLQKKGFNHIYVWLDKDKWREGREICEKAMWLGMGATAILSELDPKYYSEEDIVKKIT